MERRLLLSYTTIILLTVSILVSIVYLATDRSFSSYVQDQARIHYDMLPVMLSGYYTGHGTWDGVQHNIDEAGVVIGASVILVDNQGRVVAATQRELIGPVFQPTGQDRLIPITSGGSTQIGQVVIRRTPAQQQVDAAFIARIGYILIASSFATAFLAVALSFLFSRWLSRPLAEIASAAQHIARGNYDVRIRSNGQGDIATLAQAFNQMAIGLRSVERLRRELVSNVSHDLRTPLTVIRGYLEGLRSGQIADRRSAQHVFDCMHVEVEHLLKLVEDLRSIASLDADILILDRRPVLLADLVAQTLARITPLAGTKQIELHHRVPSDLPYVRLDRERMGQALLNLLENAIRHTPSGGAITVSAGQMDGEIQLAVHDTGDGIPAAHLPHVFERFYRIDDARSRTGGGSGLGLSIVASIVAAHDGRVEAQSDGVPGHGSTFTMWLPL